MYDESENKSDIEFLQNKIQKNINTGAGPGQGPFWPGAMDWPLGPGGGPCFDCFFAILIDF